MPLCRTINQDMVSKYIVLCIQSVKTGPTIMFWTVSSRKENVLKCSQVPNTKIMILKMLSIILIPFLSVSTGCFICISVVKKAVVSRCKGSCWAASYTAQTVFFNFLDSCLVWPGQVLLAGILHALLMGYCALV